MSNGNGNGDGDCIECRNGDWYCPPANGQSVGKTEEKMTVTEGGCPEAFAAGTGDAPEGYTRKGTIWLPLDLYRRHGFTIYYKADCSDPKDPKVGLFFEKVIEEFKDPQIP